ncbi:MAG: 2,3-dimethylmalate dehydratase large subunit [Pseudomonadota bacterium]|jgi:3-isopropylmalate/(R)-2-methylmalate dehydratase large subunit
MTPPAAIRVLYLSQDSELIQRQLNGEAITLAQALPLRDDVSTDEITPVAILSHYDDQLGDYAHTGTQCQGILPIGKGALKAARFQVIVAGKRYGKGSSREHSPTAEKMAGVQCIIAESFERIYRQNADNIGLFTSTHFELLETLTSLKHIPTTQLIEGREPLAAAILSEGGLLPWGQRHLQTLQPTPAPAAVKAMSLFEKILHRHQLIAPLTPRIPQQGEGMFVQAHWRFIHEYYTGMANTLMQSALGPDFVLHNPDQIVVFEDHSSYVNESPAHVKNGLISNMQAMTQAQREFIKKHRLKFHQTLTDDEAAKENGQNSAGISHAMMTEHYALPGQIVVGTDSHTPHSGALGCVAFGVGTTDMANAFVTGAIRLTFPPIVRIDLEGQMPAGVTAKDVMLHLLATPMIKSGQGVGKVFEFSGSGIQTLSTDDRATLTNMTAELGGLTGIIAPDQETVRFLKERRGIDFELEDWMQSDAAAVYVATLSVDMTTLCPMVASPGDPGNGIPLSSLKQAVRIDIAYGGSCTAGKREDFEHYHEVLSWANQRGLRFPPHVQVFLQYGTTAVRDHCQKKGYDATFKAMGVRILQPSCGACANCGPGSSTSSDQVTVSAINRNFPGRSGPGQVWLASPPTVMASALAGSLTSFEALKRKYNS